MDKNLIAAVDEKNLTHIKSALTSIALKDPNFSTGEFEAALRYVDEHGINLYEPFDGETFKPESDWDKNYWRYINASLEDNFCRERIDELKRVGKKIYPVQAAPVENTTNFNSSRQTNSNNQRSSSTSNALRRPRQSDGGGIPFGVKAVGSLAAIGVGCLTIGPPATLALAAAIGGVTICMKRR